MAPKAKKEKTAAETREEGRAASKKQAAEDVEGFTPEDEDLSSDEKTPKAKKSGAAAYREYKSQQGYLDSARQDDEDVPLETAEDMRRFREGVASRAVGGGGRAARQPRRPRSKFQQEVQQGVQERELDTSEMGDDLTDLGSRDVEAETAAPAVYAGHGDFHYSQDPETGHYKIEKSGDPRVPVGTIITPETTGVGGTSPYESIKMEIESKGARNLYQAAPKRVSGGGKTLSEVGADPLSLASDPSGDSTNVGTYLREKDIDPATVVAYPLTVDGQPSGYVFLDKTNPEAISEWNESVGEGHTLDESTPMDVSFGSSGDFLQVTDPTVDPATMPDRPVTRGTVSILSDEEEMAESGPRTSGDYPIPQLSPDSEFSYESPPPASEPTQIAKFLQEHEGLSEEEIVGFINEANYGSERDAAAEAFLGVQRAYADMIELSRTSHMNQTFGEHSRLLGYKSLFGVPESIPDRLIAATMLGIGSAGYGGAAGALAAPATGGLSIPIGAAGAGTAGFLAGLVGGRRTLERLMPGEGFERKTISNAPPMESEKYLGSEYEKKLGEGKS